MTLHYPTLGWNNWIGNYGIREIDMRISPMTLLITWARVGCLHEIKVNPEIGTLFAKVMRTRPIQLVGWLPMCQCQVIANYQVHLRTKN